MASGMLAIGSVLIEVEAKVERFGWNPKNWPNELSFLTNSNGHNAFFLLFLVPLIFTGYLAVARHSERSDG